MSKSLDILRDGFNRCSLPIIMLAKHTIKIMLFFHDWLCRDLTPCRQNFSHITAVLFHCACLKVKNIVSCIIKTETKAILHKPIYGFNLTTMVVPINSISNFIYMELLFFLRVVKANHEWSCVWFYYYSFFHKAMSSIASVRVFKCACFVFWFFLFEEFIKRVHFYISILKR